MDMVGLEYFIAAARFLNFTRAAEECCITQTAMSLHIAKLEKELGFKLFYRNNRSVSLSPGGATFYKEALSLLKLYKEAVSKSSSAASGAEGILRIGFTNYIERGFLPELIRSFRKQYPQIEIILNKNEQPLSLNELQSGLNDLILVFPYDAEKHEDLELIPLASHPVCAVIRKDHPLAVHDAIDLKELFGEAVIIISRSQSPFLYQQVQKDWLEQGFFPEAVLEADSADGILFFVEAGFGNALMPRYIRQMSGSALKILDLKNCGIKVEIAAAYSRKNKNPALKLFLAALEDFRKNTPKGQLDSFD